MCPIWQDNFASERFTKSLANINDAKKQSEAQENVRKHVFRAFTDLFYGKAGRYNH
jgi:hypothetical protein